MNSAWSALHKQVANGFSLFGYLVPPAQVVHLALLDPSGRSLMVQSAVVIDTVAHCFGTLRRRKRLTKSLRDQFLKQFEELCQEIGATRLRGEVPSTLAKSHCQRYGFQDTGVRVPGPSEDLHVIEKPLDSAPKRPNGHI